MNVLTRLFSRNTPVLVMADAPVAVLRQVRVGMWVVREQPGEPPRVGIVEPAKLDPVLTSDSLLPIAYVDENGETLRTLPTPVRELRQARHLDIPARRRPSGVAAAALGYEAGGGQ